MKTILRFILLTLLLGARIGWAASDSNAAPTWNPATTYAVIVGVLHWREGNLATYPTDGRQDEQLYRTLLARGVPASHVQLLLDEDATLAGIRRAITDVASAAPAESTFIFYYAGHGLKKGHEVRFANYDVEEDNTPETSLSPNEIARLLNEHFKGHYVWLMADCCYSGALKQVVDSVARKGKAGVSLTSADESSRSTGNWTFTETVIAGLRGQSPTLEDLSEAVGSAMQCREQQHYGFYNKGWSPNTVMAQGNAKRKPRKESCASADASGGVQVEWQGKWYAAQILKQDGQKYFIHYSGYEAKWDEWVGPDRIRGVQK